MAGEPETEKESSDAENAAEPNAAAAEPSEAAAADESEESKRLHLEVHVDNAGPCRKRIRVTIPPEDIAAQFNEEFTELVENAAIPGFRPGHAPRRLIERKFRKEAADQVKRKLMMASLEQIGDENNIEPISEPQIDVAAIELPETGPMVYEFEVEVRPEFDLPEYKAIKIQRPVKEFAEADVNKQLERFLQSYGQLVPKSGTAQAGDYLVTDVAFRDGAHEVSRTEELLIRIQPVLRFRDGTIERFAKAVLGAKPGDTRTAQVRISDEAPNQSLRGRTIETTFTIKDLKRLRLPELTPEFLEKLGYASEGDLRDALHSVLRRRLEYEQRRVARQQLLDQLLKSVNIELPPDLVKRQVQATLRRHVLELRNAGYNEDEIRRRTIELQQNSISATRQSLREHFLLAKIAEVEELKVTPEDIENQIEIMALQSDESPRRVRSRLEKEGMLDALEVQILEQFAADRALEYAVYEDVPLVEKDEADEAIDEAATSEEETESGEPAAAAQGE
jgi:trigger factor